MARKAVDRLRRHPQVVDLLWSLPLVAYSLITIPGVVVPAMPGNPPDWAYLVLTTALVPPLIWRRRWPRGVFAFIALACFAQWLADVEPVAANMALLVALYTVASRCSLRWGVAAALVGELGFVLALLDDGPEEWKLIRNALITTSIFILGILILGRYIHTRHAYLQSLEDRAVRAERERDTQIQIAMAAERARIARELHDVIAHNVSVIVVQADGAAFAIETDVDQAKNALETISSTGRLALSEMRRLLGVLREGDDTGTYTPQPGVEQLTELADQVRGAGLPLECTVEGVPAELPPGLQLTVFRIVQESLTNTLKHAGPGATARVRLRFRDDAVEINVRDDGRGSAAWQEAVEPKSTYPKSADLKSAVAKSAAAKSADPAHGDFETAGPAAGRGHGLAGMRERAALYGGTVRAQPAPGGGFEVAALLPIPMDPAESAVPAAPRVPAAPGGKDAPGPPGVSDLSIKEATH